MPTPTPGGQPRWKLALGFAAIYLIWGSTYLAIRICVDTMPPFLMAGARFLASGLLLCAWARIRGAAAPRRSHWLPAFVLGLLLLASNGLVAWAETRIPSGPTSLLTAMAPMWIVLADWVRPGGVAPTRTAVFGVLIGFGGIVALVNPAALTGLGGIDPAGALVLVVATLAWAIGSVSSRHVDQPSSKLLYVGLQMTLGGAALLVVAVLAGETSGFDPRAVSRDSWLAVAYLTSVGTIGFVAYIWLLSATLPARVATYAYVNPVIALVLGNRLLGEALGARTLACAAVIVLAVVIIVGTKSDRPPRKIPVTGSPPRAILPPHRSARRRQCPS